jgi:hypothetical protein
MPPPEFPSSCAIMGAKGRNTGYWPPFAPCPLGPGVSWDGLGVVQGVQLCPWAAGFGGR